MPGVIIMKKLIKLTSVLFLTIFVFITFFGLRSVSSQEAYTKVFESGDDFKLYYYTKDDVVFFKMESRTTGYVAIGFEPSAYMKDADMVIAYVKDGAVSIIDAYSTGDFDPP